MSSSSIEARASFSNAVSADDARTKAVIDKNRVSPRQDRRVQIEMFMGQTRVKRSLDSMFEPQSRSPAAPVFSAFFRVAVVVPTAILRRWPSGRRPLPVQKQAA